MIRDTLKTLQQVAHLFLLGAQIRLRVSTVVTWHGTRSTTATPARSTACTFSGLFDSRPHRGQIRNSAGSRRAARSCAGPTRSPAARWPPPCPRPDPAVRRRAACSAGRCRGLPGARRSAARGLRRRCCFSAISSCARQSQRRLWKTSPVRHWEWIRTSGGGPARSPIFSTTASSVRSVELASKPVDPESAEFGLENRLRPPFRSRSAREMLLHRASC